MKLEKQVLTMEQAKHLQELGLDMSDAALCWSPHFPFDIGKYAIYKVSETFKRIIKGERDNFLTSVVPTYTLQEVWDKLPKEVVKDGKRYELLIYYPNDGIYEVNYTCKSDYEDSVVFLDDDLLNAVYNMLCWVVENGYLEEDKK